jgi:hypothetical protein
VKVYYFEKIKVWSEQGFETQNIYFTKELIVPSHYINWLHKRKIDANGLWLGPGKVMLDLDFPLRDHKTRDHHVRKYLYRGCSLLISILDLERKLNWRSLFHSYVHELKGLAIDYMVVPKVNIKHLTPDMIRFFGLQKVPFILVELTNGNDLDQVKWGWLKQMQMISKIPLACFDHRLSSNLINELNNHQMLAVSNLLSNKPIPKQVLVETGISPKKGEIRMYGDADFNLYEMKRESEFNRVHGFANQYTEQYPYISVLKGNVVKLRQTVIDKKGFGDWCKISIQNHF